MAVIHKVFALFACACYALSVTAAEYTVSDADGWAGIEFDLADGDTVNLKPGVYRDMQMELSASVTVRGAGEGVIIDADGKGSGIMIRWPRVRLENVTIRNFGKSLYDRDAGVSLTDGANDVVISNVRIEGAAFGIRADNVERLTVENCDIRGDSTVHVLDRGDGIYLNYVKGPVLRGNRFLNTRDSIYLENVTDSLCENNRFSGAQYGIHWMYTQRGTARNNAARGVRGGYAVMSSKHIRVEDNISTDNIEFGVLLNVAEQCDVHNNRIERVHNPKGKPALNSEGKGIFIYGPGQSFISRNRIALCDIGIGVALSSENNVVWDNAFIDNYIQVRYVGEKGVEWSKDGTGNFWSTYLGWDLNHDGAGDKPYQPNDSLDRIFWIYPEARFLMDSPVTALLRWLAGRFEIDRGKGITDSRPQMQWNNPALPALNEEH